MTTKKDLIRVVRKGNYSNSRLGSELVCDECGCYDHEGVHKDDCAVGKLLQLIEENK